MPRSAIAIGAIAFVVAVALALASSRGTSPERPQPASQQPAVEVAGAQSESNWREFAPKLKSNSEIAIAQLDNLVFVIGGYPSTRVFEDTVEIYDARTDSWQFGPALPQPMHHTMAVGINGKVYVIGGETSTSGLANQGIYLDTVYEYDPAGDSWTELPDLPTQRNHLAAGAIAGKLYVAGGRFGGGVGSEMTAIVEVYDPATNTWGSRAPMPTPRGGVNGIAVNGCLYTFGGEGNDDHPFGVFDQTEVYNPVTDSWSSLEPIPIPVQGVTGLAVIDGWIHLPGGGIMRGGSSGTTLHQAFRAYMSCE